MDDNKKLPYFFLGLGIGVAVGVLFAPKSGDETRRLLAEKANEGSDYVRRRSAEFKESATEYAGKVKESATEYVDKGRSVVNRQRDQFSAAVEAGKAAYREAVGEPSKSQPAPEGV